MIYFMIVMIILAIILKSPTIKGKIGENAVSRQLSKLDKDKYIILNDVTIPNGSGRTSQIDHVVISKFGIFVIETKNYRGWIMGDEKSEQWTQVIYKRKEKLYNPIRQNYGHVMALKGVLAEYENLPIIPVVCFSDRANLKVKVSSEVIYTSQLVQTIKKYNQIVLNIDIKHIANVIAGSKIIGKNTKKQHVKSIKDEVKDNTNKVANNICPKCGGNLVLRNGKYGKFKGCSNYPKCRFVYRMK